MKKPVDDTLESDSGDQQKIITRLQATETDATHGAGIFTYTYLKNGRVLCVHLPAPWASLIWDKNQHVEQTRQGTPVEGEISAPWCVASFSAMRIPSDEMISGFIWAMNKIPWWIDCYRGWY